MNVSPEEFYRDELTKLLALVEEAGRSFGNQAAIVAEDGGERDELRRIIAGIGRIGDAMVGAVERTRSKIEEREAEDA